MKKINIAIDGPSGAGKSTISRIIADKFGSGNDGTIIEIIGKSYMSEMRDGYYFLTGVVDLIENIAREVEFEADFGIYDPNIIDEVDKNDVE